MHRKKNFKMKNMKNELSFFELEKRLVGAWNTSGRMCIRKKTEQLPQFYNFMMKFAY
jgi:hypothetical protein